MPQGDTLRFAAYTAIALLVAHAVAFLAHEYSHATMAWLLGFKTNPLALDYGRLDLSNVLLQQEMDENVDYGPVYAGGHGGQAALIALAGPWIGNGMLYVLVAMGLVRGGSRLQAPVLLLLFWVSVMAAGNLWSYAPVRTVTNHGDMAYAARGLGISGWTLLPIVVVPSLLAGWHLFGRVLPVVLARGCGGDPMRRALVVSLACMLFFTFFGAASINGNYGDVSAVVSILSVFVLMPLVLAASLSRAGVRDRDAER